MCETLKGVKTHNFLVCASKFQGFAQSQKFLVRSHNRETVTFRHSGSNLECKLHIHMGLSIEYHYWCGNCVSLLGC